MLEIKKPTFCNKREIWWCSLGVNIGAETCGKNELFERPVLVLRVYNLQSILVAPLTSRPKDDSFHKKIRYENTDGWVILSHARTISPKRLQRKLTRLDEDQYMLVMRSLGNIMNTFDYESAPVLTGASEPEGLMWSFYQKEPYCQADLDELNHILQ